MHCVTLYELLIFFVMLFFIFPYIISSYMVVHGITTCYLILSFINILSCVLCNIRSYHAILYGYFENRINVLHFIKSLYILFYCTMQGDNMQSHTVLFYIIYIFYYVSHSILFVFSVHWNITPCTILSNVSRCWRWWIKVNWLKGGTES